jgi:DNA modification methylase
MCQWKHLRLVDQAPILFSDFGISSVTSLRVRHEHPATAAATPLVGQAYLPNSLIPRVVGIDELRAYENRARSRNRRSQAKLARSIERFGQLGPVLIDESFTIVDGHDVWQALKSLGHTHIWIAIVAGRSAPEVKALRLALNRLPQDAAWRGENVREELEELITLSFDLELTGFDAVEIDHYLDLDVPTANVVEDDDVPAVQATAITRSGDIWLCGKHRVGCGSALEGSFVATLMAGSQAAMAFIDPPYNVPIEGHASGKGKHVHREFVQASGEMSAVEFETFLTDALHVVAGASMPSALLYACMDWRHLLPLLAAGRRLNLPLLNVVVWAKTNAGMGALYRSQHELIAVFKAGADPHLNNVELGRHGRSRSNVWTYRGMTSFGNGRDELLAAHPTVKPVMLVADAIRDCTARGDIVLDTFLGSGTTLVAAEETGRAFRGCDLDPLYVDVAIRRWQAKTHVDAVNETTGETFDQRAAKVATIATEIGNG